MRRRHYHNGEAEFRQEPVNDAVVKVTHQNQVGWTGFSLDWDGQRPYTSTTIPSQMRSDGIDGAGFLYSTTQCASCGVWSDCGCSRWTRGRGTSERTGIACRSTLLWRHGRKDAKWENCYADAPSTSAS